MVGWLFTMTTMELVTFDFLILLISSIYFFFLVVPLAYSLQFWVKAVIPSRVELQLNLYRTGNATTSQVKKFLFSFFFFFKFLSKKSFVSSPSTLTTGQSLINCGQESKSLSLTLATHPTQVLKESTFNSTNLGNLLKIKLFC